jgi:hypothetical protein
MINPRKTASPTARGRCPRFKRSTGPGLFPLAAPRFNPARELMICLGWLRLFQAIVSENPAISRRRQ